MFHPEILCCSTPDFEILGAPIGSPDFCTAFIEKKYKEANQLLYLLPKLCDPQSVIALLRVCASFCRLAHLARSIPPTAASLEGKSAAGLPVRSNQEIRRQMLGAVIRLFLAQRRLPLLILRWL